MLHAKCILCALSVLQLVAPIDLAVIQFSQLKYEWENKSYVPELTEKQQNPVFVSSENSLAAQFGIQKRKKLRSEVWSHSNCFL